jgi:hypothetical protein
MHVPLKRPAAFGRILAAAALLSLAVPADAQEQRSWCFRGQPEPACAAFLVSTLNYFPGREGQSEGSVTWNLVEWEDGWMTNRGPATADGYSVAVGVSNTGFHLSAERRYRRWLGRGLALDAGAGVTITQHPPNTYPHRYLAGPTADVALGLTDWAALSARGEILLGPETVGRLDVGVRLGTLPGLILGALGALLHLGDAISAA